MRMSEPGKEAGGSLWPRAGAALLAVLVLCGPGGAAAGVVVRQVRTWTAPDHTRVVLDLSGPASYEVRRVGDPERIAVTVAGARFETATPLPVDDGLLQRVRRNSLRGRAQVVLDLERPARFRHFVLAAASGRPHRIVVDVFRPVAPEAPGADGGGAGADAVAAPGGRSPAAGPAARDSVTTAAPAAPAGAPVDDGLGRTVASLPGPSGPAVSEAAFAAAGGGAPAAAADKAPVAGSDGAPAAADGAPGAPAGGQAPASALSEAPASGADRALEASAPAPVPAPPRPFVVVIDPGHGGLDPGAMRAGLQEKDLTLDIARELARQVEALPGYRAVLTRTGDYFVSLADRVRIAQKAGGDVFLSIHCNTNRKLAMDGMEVYFLSLQGATDREAQELADAENAADLVGLAPDEAGDDSVLSILMDLRMTRVLDRSSQLAEAVLGAARRSPVVAARKVKQARFQVLRSLAMPSALVEMAFLSNEQDRRLLATAPGRRQLAGLLKDGLLSYRGQGEAVLAEGPARAGTRGGAAAKDWTRTYKVRRGDTLWRLAERHGTTIEEISRRNQLRSQELRVGQRLRLPAAD